MGLLLATGALNKKEPKSPQPREVYREGQTTLDALGRLAPQQYALTDEYTRRYGELYSDVLSRSRERDVEDLERLGPEALSAYRNLNPEQQALMSELNRQALGDLQMGTQMDPTEVRQVQQATRSNRSSYGFGQGSNNDLLREAIALTGSGRALQDRRRDFAGAMTGRNMEENRAALGDLTSIGKNSGTLLGAAIGAGSIDPFNSYAQDVYDTNFNAKWSNKLSIRNYNAAVTGALIGAIGDIVGGAAGGAAGGV